MLLVPVIFTLLGVPGACDSDRFRTRSYSADRREVLGVCGTATELEPVWLTGVDGRSGLERSGDAAAREGVTGTALLFLGRDVGVIGNGMANSPAARFVGVARSVEGDDERLGEGGVCKAGVAVWSRDFGDLGDREASLCVRADCCGAGGTTEGRSTMGGRGTLVSFLCSRAQRCSLSWSSCSRCSPPAVQRATAAMPLVMFLSMSISTSIPIPYAGIRFPADFTTCIVGVMTRPIPPLVHCFGW